MEDEENIQLGGQAIAQPQVQEPVRRVVVGAPVVVPPALSPRSRQPIFDQENLPLENQENIPLENQENVEPSSSLADLPSVIDHVQTKTRLRVKITRWNGVAVWKWCANDDTCGICRFPFHGCCPDCKYAGDDCPLVWGQCTHCFHIHCIMKWLGTSQTQHQCPMCRQEWKFKE